MRQQEVIPVPVQWLKDQVRVLTFRLPSRSIAEHSWWYLLFGLLITWFAGLGRYWDHPSADWWQYAGFGSVLYVLVLAGILWLVVLPLKPERWSYRSVLVFVTMTSLPALLYAIPVERWLSAGDAASANALFLQLVAAWRVALLIWFLSRFAKLGWAMAGIVSLLPLALIVISLAILNLEHAVFQIMAGIREQEPSPYDQSYAVVVGLTYLAFLSSPGLLGLYLAAIVQAANRRRDERIAEARRQAFARESTTTASSQDDVQPP